MPAPPGVVLLPGVVPLPEPELPGVVVLPGTVVPGVLVPLLPGVVVLLPDPLLPGVVMLPLGAVLSGEGGEVLLPELVPDLLELAFAALFA